MATKKKAVVKKAAPKKAAPKKAAAPKKKTSPKGTTKIGFVSRRGQVVVRPTGIAGTDHGQKVYQVACSKCGHNYGSNGSDIHDHKCPKCQGGHEGLAY
jgi:hypothetical protein